MTTGTSPLTVRDPPASRGLHILRVADVPNVATAGMSGFMLSSAEEMKHCGHRVSFWFQDLLLPSLSHPGLRRLVVPWLIVAKILAAVRRGERYDVIEIHEPLAGAYALVARLSRFRLPACVALSHGLEARGWEALHAHLRSQGRSAPLRSRVLVPLTLLSQARVALSTAEAVIVLCSADRDYVVEHMGVPMERVMRSCSGVAEHFFEIERTPHDDARMLFLGSWIERKGTDELLSAWRRLAAHRSEVRLTLAGVGNAGRARAETRDLPRVSVVPVVEREELPALLAAHDVFVLPSYNEGMPMSMLEAAAAGLACVVSSVSGNLDVFRPGDPLQDGAVLVPPNDAGALYRAMLRLVDDVDLRAALGARARERARRFTWGRSAQLALAAFEGAIERREARNIRSGDRHVGAR